MHLGGNRHWFVNFTDLISLSVLDKGCPYLYPQFKKRVIIHHFHSCHSTMVYITNSQWPSLQLT